MAPRPRLQDESSSGIRPCEQASTAIRCAVVAGADARTISCGGCGRPRRVDSRAAQTWRSGRERHLADLGGRRLRWLAARTAAMIRIDALWLCTQPLDMRAG